MTYKKEKKFIKVPEYPGGNKKLNEFISSNLKYPEEAVKNNIQGVVSIMVFIGYNGEVEKVQIINGIGYGCDEEACRVARLIKFLPQKNRGLKVKGKRKINIHFNKKKDENITIKYVTKKTEKKEKPQKNNNKYGYTISW